MGSFFEASYIGLWAIVGLNVLLTLALVRKMTSNSEYGLAVGESAPEFTAETLDGEIVSLSHYKGKKVAFVFISSGCQPCIDEIPTLEAAYKGAEKSGIEIVLISTDNPKVTKDFVEQMHISIPILIAPKDQNKLMEDYKVPGTPFLNLINERGEISQASIFSPQIKEQIGQWAVLSD